MRQGRRSRALASSHFRTVADIDLILWTYSIRKHPFTPPAFPVFRAHFVLNAADRMSLTRDPESFAERVVEKHLTQLKEAGHLTRDLLIAELSLLFAFIRDECIAFGRRKRGGLRDRVELIVKTLDQAMGARNPERLLSLWTRWQDMVDTLSGKWKGINLPGSMVLEGYMVLEHFIPGKDFIESYYERKTFEPTYACD